MRKKFLLGNWKMNKTPSEGKEFASKVAPLVKLAKENDIDIGVAPTFLALPSVLDARPEGLIVSSQNVNEHEKGAYTGEVSPTMLKAVGVTHAIIGHSERREYNGETSKACNLKVKALLAQGLVPVYCCGESLETYEKGETFSFVKEQIETGLAGLSSEEALKVVIAYEPIWAIGTGKSASIDDAENTIEFIRDTLKEMFGQETADEMRILYGGSVKPENVRGYMGAPDIDGALVGGASLDIESFKALVEGMI